MESLGAGVAGRGHVGVVGAGGVVVSFCRIGVGVVGDAAGGVQAALAVVRVGDS